MHVTDASDGKPRELERVQEPPLLPLLPLLPLHHQGNAKSYIDGHLHCFLCFATANAASVSSSSRPSVASPATHPCPLNARYQSDDREEASMETRAPMDEEKEEWSEKNEEGEALDTPGAQPQPGRSPCQPRVPGHGEPRCPQPPGHCSQPTPGARPPTPAAWRHPGCLGLGPPGARPTISRLLTDPVARPNLSACPCPVRVPGPF
ncbi:translation initiation factor IF-2 [Triticum aestivum]|uniref:translation initiation factor IF-2 n=1 Tax=Triticum aestivum TaxID=4565 RepID=UPI001D02FC74|nr:translation initiation factor IF-2-like [Triticum aestivum]